jgi:hypothetical protein
MDLRAALSDYEVELQSRPCVGIDKRLREIRDDLEGLGLSPSSPTYAEAVRDSEVELADIAARLGKDAPESI